MTHEEIQAVIDAWTVPGPQPEYHYAAQRRLRIEWPALAQALDKMVEAIR